MPDPLHQHSLDTAHLAPVAYQYATLGRHRYVNVSTWKSQIKDSKAFDTPVACKCSCIKCMASWLIGIRTKQLWMPGLVTMAAYMPAMWPFPPSHQHHLKRYTSVTSSPLLFIQLILVKRGTWVKCTTAMWTPYLMPLTHM